MRLADYDYSQNGAYFVSICLAGRRCLLGEIIGDRMVLNPLGEAVGEGWQTIAGHFHSVELGPFVVMPNHFHGIVWIASASPVEGLTDRPNLGQVIGWFKYESARRVNAMRGTPGERFWQRNYYDHIVRSEEGLYAIAEYIDGNPGSWQKDEMNPGA